MLLAITPMVELFTKIGIGQWFRVATGTLEVGGAVLLLIPATYRLAAALLLVIMLAGVATHWFVIGGSGLPAVGLGTACAWLVFASRRPAPESPGVTRHRNSVDWNGGTT